MKRLAALACLVTVACAAAPKSVSISAPDTVSVSASDAVPGSVPASAPASASVSDSFPIGWYDSDDGSVVYLASPTKYAMIWGRDIEPRALLGDGFVRDAAKKKWVGRELVLDCEGREIEERVEVARRGEVLRIETASASDCVPRTARVLTAIASGARRSGLEALMAEATSTRACAALARCCRSLRGRELIRTGGMCSQPTSSSIECHDRRLEIATALRLGGGACVE